MAWTQAQLDALSAAIAKGVTTVSYDGNRVEYRSLDEMLKLKQEMENDISGGTSGSVKRRLAAYSTGL